MGQPSAPERPVWRHLPTVAQLLFREAPAWPLAAARVAVFAMIASRGITAFPDRGAGFVQLRRFAAMPDELAFPPTGWAFVQGNPFNPTLVGIAALAMAAAAIAAALGWRLRWTGWIAVLLGIYVLAVPQWFGKVNHYHHLLWFGALLASAPSADTWAVGRWRARPAASGRYGGPIRAAWLLIGLMYLFPGIYKVNSGPGWVWSDNMANLVWTHRWMGQATVAVGDPDRLLPLLQVGAVAVILFEVGFIALVWTRLRVWLVVAGMAFHLGTGPLLGIWGIGWLVVYPLLLGHHGRSEPARRSPAVPMALGLSMAVLAVGLLGTSSGWPLALYPTFASYRPPVVERVVAVDDYGTRIDVRDLVGWMPPERSVGLVRSVVASRDPTKLAALADLTELEGGVGFVSESVDVRTGQVIEVRPLTR